MVGRESALHTGSPKYRGEATTSGIVSAGTMSTQLVAEKQCWFAAKSAWIFARSHWKPLPLSPQVREGMTARFRLASGIERDIAQVQYQHLQVGLGNPKAQLLVSADRTE